MIYNLTKSFFTKILKIKCSKGIKGSIKYLVDYAGKKAGEPCDSPQD